MAQVPRYNRAKRIEDLRNSIPLGYLIKFPCAMTPAQLQEIPKVTIAKEQAALRIPCAVCFHRFKLNETDVRQLPCKHLYHEKCIFPWLQENPSCPTCREPLVNQEDEDFEDIIREHYSMLTRDLMRHLAVNQFFASISDSESSESESDVGTQGQVPSAIADGNRSVRSSDRSNRGPPRRAAALRADSAIAQIYRPRRTVNAPKNIATRSTKRE